MINEINIYDVKKFEITSSHLGFVLTRIKIIDSKGESFEVNLFLE